MSALEFAARGDMQFAQIVGTVVGHGVAFEPSPQVLDGIYVWCVGRQECNLDVSAQAVQVLAYKATAVCFESVPDYQQRLFQMGLERLEEFDDLFLLDAALVQPKKAVGPGQS